MKKIIAMAVAVMMLVSVCVVGAVPAAAESAEKLIVDFDGVGPAAVSGQNSSVGTVDGVGEGNVAILNLVGWQSLYIRLPENFGYGSPTQLTFWAKTDAGNVTTTTDRNGFTNTNTGVAKIVLEDLNVTFGAEWTKYTINLPEMSDLEASTYYYFTINPEKFSDGAASGASKLYVDDISLVYADAADVPSDDWQAMFDWEEGYGDEVQLVGNGKAKAYSDEASPNTAADSNHSLYVYRAAWNQSGYSTNYVQINLDPEMMQNVDDLRINYRSGKGDSNKKPTMGVVVDGEVYWGGSAYFGGNLTSTTWAQQSVTAYTYGNFRADGESAEKPTITITKANLAEVEALVFTTAQYNDGKITHYANSWILLDDIEYTTKGTEPSAPTASFEGTETPVESIDGTSIVMPEGTVAGKLFAGWSDGENLYAAGSTVEIAQDTTFTAVGVEAATQDGAAVRLLTPTGLRFETRINKADYDAIAALGATVKTGTLILPNDYLTGDIVLTKESLDANDKIYLDIENSGWYNAATAEADGYYQYFATIANIKTKNYTREFVSAGYLEISYADGSSTVLLYCGDGSNTVRTVSNVAKAALEDPEGNYTEEEKQILQGYVTTEE